MSKKQQIVCIAILCFFINSIAFSKDINTLLSFSHVENQPDNTTTINVEWTASTTSGDKYFAAFSKGMTYVFNDYDPSEPENVPDHVLSPVQQFSDATDSTSQTVDTDGSYYFNIVIDSDGDYGATKSIGPFIIDTTEPSPVSVNGITSTDSNSIELTLEPADAEQVCILLNTTNILSCDWTNIPESRKLVSPALSSGNNQIYAFFKDVAGNTNQASHSVSCIIEENDTEQTTYKSVVVPTMNEWGQILTMGILILASLTVMRKKQT